MKSPRRFLMFISCIFNTAVIAYVVLGLPKQHVEWITLCSLISTNGTVIAMYLEAIYEKLNSNKP